MPLLSEEKLPKYRRHRATGQAVVTLSGRDFYLGKYGSAASRQEYDRRITEWLTGGRRPLESAGLTVTELIASYWRFAKGYYRCKNGKPTDELAGIRLAMRRLRKLYGSTLAADFGPKALKAIREQMFRANLSRTYINTTAGRIKRMFKWAVSEELVPSSVHHGLQAVTGLKRGRTAAREPEPVKPVPDEYVDAIRPHVSRQVWAMIELQRLTGMRPGEVTIMYASDLDTSGKVWTYRPREHKTEFHGHDRIVEIGPKGQTIIKPFLKRDLEAHLFSPIDAEQERSKKRRKDRKTRVQPSQHARQAAARLRNRARPPRDRYTTDSYRRAIARACEATSVDRWHPHQLRHNFATAVRREYGLELARILCGHRSAAVTELYAEVDRTRAAEVALKIG